MPGKTTCPKIRKLRIQRHLDGFSIHAISASLNFPQSTVSLSRIIQLLNRTGNKEATKSPGRSRITNNKMDRLAQWFSTFIISWTPLTYIQN